MSHQAISPARRFTCQLLCSSLLIGWSSGIFSGTRARADVVFPEPNSQTLARSAVIAVARLADSEGTPPFTNAHPPVLVFEVKQSIRGTQAGQRLRVAGFINHKPTARSGVSSEPEGPAALAAATRKWQEAAPPIPPQSEDVLLFLEGDPAAVMQPVRGAFGNLVYFTAPDPALLSRVTGMASFSLSSLDGRDLSRKAGGPLKVKLQLTNLTRAPARFDLRAIRLFGHLPPDRDLPETPLPIKGDPLIKLAAGQSKILDWDMKKLFPGQFDAPGAYWLRVRAPASCGLLDQFELNIDLK